MVLYLVQHAEAASATEDPGRSLTQKGRREAAAIGRLLARLEVTCREIRHSAKRRAEQTAEIIAAELSPRPPLVAASGLAPNDPVEPLQATLEAEGEDVMLVGHLPHLGKLASLLLAGKEELAIVRFTPGTVARLRREGRWVLDWLLPPQAGLPESR